MFNTVKNSVKYEIKKYGEKKKIKVIINYRLLFQNYKCK